MKYNFLTDEFYSSEYKTLDVFNKLIKNDKLISENDMYSNGGFLVLEVYDNEEARNILKSLISDFDEYKKQHNEDFYPSKNDKIGLCLLHDIHWSTFGNETEIMWDNEYECFEFKCTIESDED